MYRTAIALLVALERPTLTNTAPAAPKVVQEQPSVPLGPSPSREELERQRLDEGWRQLPSLKSSTLSGIAGAQRRGFTLHPFMLWRQIQRMSDDDLRAIYRYLRTLLPIRNEVPRRVGATGREAGGGFRTMNVSNGPLRIGASILIICVTMMACGRRTAPAETTGSAMDSTALSTTVAPPRATAADIGALNRILLHHEQTVALAERVLDRAVHSELREFSGGVIRDRRQEIDQLRRLGATSMAAVKPAPELDDTSNETIDVLFVTTLAIHEEAGRTMATELLRSTTNPDVKSFAEGVINKAGSELTQLNAWKQQWSEIGHQDRERE